MARSTAAERAAKDLRVVGSELATVLPSRDKPWYLTWHLLRLNIILLVPIFSSGSLGFDGAMMNALQAMPYWKKFFDHPSAAKLGLMNAIFPVGKVCGLLIVTPLSDRFGRRIPLFLAFIICIIGAAIQGASVNMGMFTFSRFLLGIGTAFMAQPSPILITELAYPTHRGKVTSLYNTFYFTGAIFAAWSSYGTLPLESDWSWRIPSILQGVFPLVQLLFIYFVPESPRWLIAKGRSAEAQAILICHHAGGDESSLLVEYEVQEIEAALRLEQDTETLGWKYLFIGRANRWRTFIAVNTGFFNQWAGNGVISYYLTLVLDTVGITDAKRQSEINGGLQIFNFLAAVFAGAMMVDRLGRRTLFLWSSLGMCISYTVWTILNSQFIAKQSSGVGIAVIPMIFVFYFHYDIAFTPLAYAYPTEIFPYALRGWGVSVTYISSHISLIVGQFVNPIAMKAISWRFYILFCILNAILFVIVYFVYPETKGHSLEEIAHVFEGGYSAAATRGLIIKGADGTVECVEATTESKA